VCAREEGTCPEGLNPKSGFQTIIMDLLGGFCDAGILIGASVTLSQIAL